MDAGGSRKGLDAAAGLRTIYLPMVPVLYYFYRISADFCAFFKPKMGFFRSISAHFWDYERGIACFGGFAADFGA
jgi:hypothetical protein